MELLKNVVDFNIKFYPTNWAHLEELKAGTIKLIPNIETIKKLSGDYHDMESMLYGEKPTFSEIIETIEDLEGLFNKKGNIT